MRDGDPRALALFLRHYSSNKAEAAASDPSGRKKRFMGPGEHLVLLTHDCRALFGWRKQKHRSDTQRGVECTIFRNEQNEVLASELVLEAEAWAWRRWPGERLFTFVNSDAVRSANPGLCFKQAGWHFGGLSKSGLMVLYKQPADQLDVETHLLELEVIEAAALLHRSWELEDADWHIAAEWLQEAVCALQGTEYDPYRV